ncbi:hypothetical protein [Actinoalloteichus hymeniacidonis]|uniref:Uncharacterized protein n=1 Tax=Actinoalloteichus hymeniacidonis TaxID=340345 RepID=A0AAC9HT88_9PSEU|nr:hypothetical protein [Actinoalloteichus hymeniacidonis]AOS64960.1 hypothetical protein TL08_20845 [Actinoalloteichus hymeniacidonis]MBB5906965.1 hypothetical protein [Actinoalloteichus hymeniacidonis]
MTAVMVPSQEWSATADGTVDPPVGGSVSAEDVRPEVLGGSHRAAADSTARLLDKDGSGANAVTFDEIRETIARRLMNCRADETPSSWRTLLEIATRLAATAASTATGCDESTPCLLWSVGIAVTAGQSDIRRSGEQVERGATGAPTDLATIARQPLLDAASDIDQDALSRAVSIPAHQFPGTTLPISPRLGTSLSAGMELAVSVGDAGRPSAPGAGCHSSEPPLYEHFLRPQLGDHQDATLRWGNADEPADPTILGPAVLALRAAVDASVRRVSNALETFQRCSMEARIALESVDRRHERPNVESLPLPPWPDVDTDIDRWWYQAGLSPDARALPRIDDDLIDRARRLASRVLAAIDGWEHAEAEAASVGRPDGVDKADAANRAVSPLGSTTPRWLTRLNGDCDPALLRSTEAVELRSALADFDLLVALELMTLIRLTTGIDGQGPLAADVIARYLLSPSRLGGDPGLRATARELATFVLCPAFEAMVRNAEERLDRDRRWRDERRIALSPLAAAARNHGPDARLVRAWSEVSMRVDTVEAELAATIRARQRAGRSGLNVGAAGEQQSGRPRLLSTCRPPRREAMAGAHQGPPSR